MNETGGSFGPSDAVQKVDLLIRGAGICDGTGRPWFPANLAVRGDRIAAVGVSVNPPASRCVDADGLMIAPGFIDTHTHADTRIVEYPAAENYVRQGVTTVVGGNCGGSDFPIGRHLEEVGNAGPAINYATLAGHGTIRRQVMGMEARRAGAEDMDGMQRLARQAMREGALGISSGLAYLPGTWAESDEVTRVCRAAVEAGGRIYATHIRNSADSGVLDSVSEAARIGRGAGISVQIAHLKVLHRGAEFNPALMGEQIALIRRFREEGIDIAWDVYPYTAMRTSLKAVLIPDRLSEGDRLNERLGDGAVRRSIEREVMDKIEHRGGPGKIRVLLEGGRTESLAALSELRGTDPAQAAMDMVAESNPTAICHSMRQEDVDMAVTSDPGMIASDGGVVSSEGRGHPRDFGAFPRILGHYVRERKLLALEDAVRKMTFMPACRFGLSGRGLIAEGMRADIVLFDPRSIGSRANFERPNQFPDGIRMVLVNGRTAWEEGGGRCIRAGEILRGAEAQ